MELSVVGLILQYAIAPLAALCFYMFKKHDLRIEQLEKQTNSLDKAMIKIETELQFIGRDIRDIKIALADLVNKDS